MLERDFHQLLERLFDTPDTEYQCLMQEYCLSEYACKELLLYAEDIAREVKADEQADWRIELCQNIFCLIDHWLIFQNSKTVQIIRASSELVASFYLGVEILLDGDGNG